MKKYIFLTLLLAMLLVGTAYAGGGPNGTRVDFNQLWNNTYCETYWKTTGSGLVHEWRNDTDCKYQGVASLHLVFKPVDKFPTADCDDDGLLKYRLNWQLNMGSYLDLDGDEGQIQDFLSTNQQYHICFYAWDAIGKKYSAAAFDAERSAKANNARWDAMGDWYAPKR